MFGIGKAYIKTDKILTSLSVKYQNATYTGKGVLPEFTVQKESDKYRIFKKDGWFKGAPKKADGATTEEASLAYDEGTYSVYERAIKDIVTDRAMQNADAPVRPKIDATEFLTEKLMLSQEIDTWTLVTGATGLDQSGYRNALTSDTKWVDGTAATILKDLSAAIIAIVKQTTNRPNKLWMPSEVLEGIIQQAEIRDILKLASTSVVTAANPLPSLRGLAITIADAMYDDSDTPGTENYKYCMGNNAVMAFVNPSHPLTLGREFLSKTFNVARWRDDDRDGEFIKVNRVYAPKLTCLGAGWIFTGCIQA